MAFADLLGGADRVVQQQLAETVRFAQADGVPAGIDVEVLGIFDDTFVPTLVLDQEVSNHGPQVSILLADLREALLDPGYDPKLDKPVITCRGAEYEVREVQPDGQGRVVFTLLERH